VRQVQAALTVAVEVKVDALKGVNCVLLLLLGP
jgi:hypothetical protein